MASDPRPSIGASSLSSTQGRRASYSSLSRLPPLPPSTESLTTGTSIPTPAPPAPPPKDVSRASLPVPMPTTPQRKPVLRQKSPLSNEPYFASSPASTMPGAFPTTPPAASSPYGDHATPTSYTASPSASATSKSPKRPTSFRSLLSFKALRRSSSVATSEAGSPRPASPGAESTLSSLQSTLSKKRSGSFFRRKSSLGMNFGVEGQRNGNGALDSATNTHTVTEEPSEERPGTPGSDFPAMKKRKSGIFWSGRRKSSLSLAAAFNGNHATTNGEKIGPQAATAPNGIQDGPENAIRTRQDDEKPLPSIDLVPTRSWSPPPQLPAFIGAGGGLGGEDLFKDIQ